MKSESGFTLLEVLVSIVLLAIGMLGLLSMQTTAISANSFAYTGTGGVQSAEYMIDLIRTNGGINNVRYNGLDTDDDAVCDADPDCGPWRTMLQDSHLINPRGTITVLQNAPTARTDTVQVRVEWGGPKEVRRNVTLQTIIETWGS